MATTNVSFSSSPAQFPNNPDTMPVALYPRVSTKDKSQETENQLHQLREFAMHSGWTIAAAYIDHGSGEISGRNQFQALFDVASKRQFDVLLFWSLDPLSREGVLRTLQHPQRLTSYSLGYRSFAGQYFDSCGIVRDAVIVIVAQQERDRILERVRACRQRATKARARPSRARIELLCQGGESWREIALELNNKPATARKAYAREAPAFQ